MARCVRSSAVMMMAVVLVVMALSPLTSAFPGLQSFIPNGDLVPFPCDTSKLWVAVGHENPQGRGPLNSFGKDFALNNAVWTVLVCETDSDGDGLTNGQELGDPDCVWKRGQIPNITVGITHPAYGPC